MYNKVGIKTISPKPVKTAAATKMIVKKTIINEKIKLSKVKIAALLTKTKADFWR